MKSILELVGELLLGAAAIMIIAYLFDSVYVASFQTAFVLALVLSLLNKFLKPILSILSFPLTFMTLGLFKFVINGVILKMASVMLYPDFQISSFFMTMITAMCLSCLYSIIGIDYD